MKKIFIFFLPLFSLFIFGKMLTDTDAAQVEQEQGVNIFIRCKPIAKYDYLGSIKKTGLVMSGSPEEMFNIMLRRCKKEYPQADGLIFTSAAMDKADCVKFKQ